MLAKYFSIIQNYVLSASSQRKYNFYHQNTLLDAFRTNSRNIGRNPSMVIPLLANQDLTPMLGLIRRFHDILHEFPHSFISIFYPVVCQVLASGMLMLTSSF